MNMSPASTMNLEPFRVRGALGVRLPCHVSPRYETTSSGIIGDRTYNILRAQIVRTGGSHQPITAPSPP